MGVFRRKEERKEERQIVRDKPTPVIEAGDLGGDLREIHREAEAKDDVTVFLERYGSLFSKSDFGVEVTDSRVFFGEVCKLLFAVQNELRLLREQKERMG